jgi:hypothetical protein
LTRPAGSRSCCGVGKAGRDEPRDAPAHPRAEHTHTRRAGDREHAVWLLESDDRQVRTLPRLQQARAEMAELDTVRKLANQPAPRSQAVRLRELDDLATATGIDPREISKRPGYATAVKVAGKHVLRDGDATVVVWKTCSSSPTARRRECSPTWTCAWWVRLPAVSRWSA